MDEISHTLVQRLEKMIPQNGKCQVGDVSSREGQNETGVYAVIASRFYVSPMLIYCSKK
jgi:hypothetical protein